MHTYTVSWEKFALCLNLSRKICLFLPIHLEGSDRHKDQKQNTREDYEKKKYTYSCTFPRKPSHCGFRAPLDEDCVSVYFYLTLVLERSLSNGETFPFY